MAKEPVLGEKIPANRSKFLSDISEKVSLNIMVKARWFYLPDEPDVI
jgi:hypothetical protein